MTSASSLHDEAMRLASEGDALRRALRHDASRAAFTRAMEREREAAEQATREPSLALLYRSAAWLALEAEQPREAERLAAKGLSSKEVPDRLAEELRAVMEEARLRLVRPLPPPTAASSVGLHLDGPEVGYGEAAAIDVEPRREALQNLIVRTTERQKGDSFRRRGRPAATLTEQLRPRLRYAPGSVILQVTLGGPQPSLWDANSVVVEEVRRCLVAFTEGGAEALEGAITDPTYRENFALLAERLAPDGRRVTSVQVIAATAKGALPPVLLQKRPAKVAEPQPATGAPAVETLEGELRGADQTTANPTIRLLIEGRRVSVRVPDAAMEDIVRPMYGRQVRVQVKREGRAYRLVGLPELLEGDG